MNYTFEEDIEYFEKPFSYIFESGKIRYSRIELHENELKEGFNLNIHRFADLSLFLNFDYENSPHMKIRLGYRKDYMKFRLLLSEESSLIRVSYKQDPNPIISHLEDLSELKDDFLANRENLFRLLKVIRKTKKFENDIETLNGFISTYENLALKNNLDFSTEIILPR